MNFAMSDAQNDVGTATPPYGDLIKISIVGDASTARFTVTFAGPVPPKLSRRETVGLGLELGPPKAKDGTYQLFADGGERGWIAYLDTPHGFVKYPGTFAVSGDRIVFEVPWSSIGGLRRGSIAVFCDWSKRGVALGMASEDDAPDHGRSNY